MVSNSQAAKQYVCISADFAVLTQIQHLRSMVLSSLLLNKPNSFGVIFDNKLTFLPHIRYLKEKSVKVLNLLRVVAHTTWGADQHTLLHLCRSLVRSKLNYGSVVYGSALAPYLHILDPLQNHALRLCLGAFRTSPASSLCVQANKSPLYIRQRMLTTVFSQTRLISEQPGLQHLSSVQNSKLFSFQNLIKSQHWAFA